VPSDAELLSRGAATLVASWEEYARGATGASLQRLPGVAAAVFPSEPERSFYNNALLDGGLAATDRSRALDAMEAAYVAAGVRRFAAWVHESDRPMRDDLARRGYTLDTATRAMAMTLAGIRLRRPDVELASPDWHEHFRIAGVPPASSPRPTPPPTTSCSGGWKERPWRPRSRSTSAATAASNNVVTLEHAHRRGLGAALTAIQLHDARSRGCETASLQSTAMAERLYAAAGFRDLGVILEHVPPQSGSR
jgi:GNAT superfamily N-acetyltransferase